MSETTHDMLFESGGLSTELEEDLDSKSYSIHLI